MWKLITEGGGGEKSRLLFNSRALVNIDLRMEEPPRTRGGGRNPRRIDCIKNLREGEGICWRKKTITDCEKRLQTLTASYSLK